MAGETPGDTRYPHPESDNALKSKAPASGVPARPRGFILIPHDPTPNVYQMSNAPHRPGSSTVYKTWCCLAFLRGYTDASLTQPRGRAGYACANKQWRRQSRFLPDAGAPSRRSERQESA